MTASAVRQHRAARGVKRGVERAGAHDHIGDEPHEPLARRGGGRAARHRPGRGRRAPPRGWPSALRPARRSRIRDAPARGARRRAARAVVVGAGAGVVQAAPSGSTSAADFRASERVEAAARARRRIIAARAREPHPICPRWRKRRSTSTQAIIASPTGTALMPTQGSCRPLVTISVSSPARSIVLRGVRIEEVGFTAKRATIGWPVEIPPRIRPAWFDKKVGPFAHCRRFLRP